MANKSYENINYSLRPSKSIERKMLCELIQKLSSFYKLKDYQYIGFGSTYFADFSIFHKNLGLEKLISIEKDKINQSRFKFNVPFSCIVMEFEHSNDILPVIDFANNPTILWLDYDLPLKSEMLNDITTFVSKALEGSLFFITVNAHLFQEETGKKLNPTELKDFRLKKLEQNVGRNKIPLGVDGADVNVKGLPKIYRQIIDDEIRSILSSRNNGKEDNNPNKLFYQQLIYFEYKDGAKMMTIGGIICNGHQKNKYNSANFSGLDFFRDGDDPFDIEVPNLTYREIYQLDSLLPSDIDLDTGEIKNEKGVIANEIRNISDIIPLIDVQKYSKIYRYFPTFTETTN